MPYDPVRDFSPVTHLASAPNIFVVFPGVPAKSFRDFIASRGFAIGANLDFPDDATLIALIQR